MAKAKKSDAKPTAKPVKRVAKRAGRSTATKAPAKSTPKSAPDLSVIEHLRAQAQAVELLRRLSTATLADLHDAIEAELCEVQRALGAVEELIEANGEHCMLAELKK
ncbi:MAG TPA: hypothetical protein VG713_08510 [Pirellulales bacterium]|nr:hypothetical protein [Pirellulales bacterium]